MGEGALASRNMGYTPALTPSTIGSTPAEKGQMEMGMQPGKKRLWQEGYDVIEAKREAGAGSGGNSQECEGEHGRREAPRADTAQGHTNVERVSGDTDRYQGRRPHQPRQFSNPEVGDHSRHADDHDRKLPACQPRTPQRALQHRGDQIGSWPP